MHPLACAALVAAAVLGAQPGLAQTSTIAEIAAYQGPDRMARLIAGAKKEGTLSLYGSSVAEDMNPVTDAFKKKYGIDVQYWRGGAGEPGERPPPGGPARRGGGGGYPPVAGRPAGRRPGGGTAAGQSPPPGPPR